MLVNFFVLFCFSFTIGCEYISSCHDCLLDGCFWLKLQSNNYICSTESINEDSKYNVEACNEVTLSHKSNPSFSSEMHQRKSVEVFHSIQNYTSIESKLNISLPTPTVPTSVQKLRILPNLKAEDLKPSENAPDKSWSTELFNQTEKGIFSLRMKRNFCHQLRLLRNLKRGYVNQTKINILIQNNPMRLDADFCHYIIGNRRQERLLNCTACHSYKPFNLELRSPDCHQLNNTCTDCVNVGCKFIFLENSSFCLNINDSIPPDSTLIPAYKPSWCNPNLPPIIQTESSYEIGFWILLATCFIILACCTFYFIKQHYTNHQALRNSNAEAIPLNQLH